MKLPFGNGRTVPFPAVDRGVMGSIIARRRKRREPTVLSLRELAQNPRSTTVVQVQR